MSGDGTGTGTGTAAARAFHRHAVMGAPVSCLSLPSRGLCVYGQGGWLERRRLPAEAASPSSSSSPSPSSLSSLVARGGDRVLALGGATGIHGIRYSGPADGTALAAVFGGRQLAIVRHVPDSDRAMARVALLLRPRREAEPSRGGPVETKFETKDCLHVPDWIMDCQWTERDDGGEDDGPESGAHVLAVGLAHNAVELWRLWLPLDGDGAAAPPGHAHRLAVVQGASRTIAYCLHLHAGAVAVGLPRREVRVWSLEAPGREARLAGHRGCLHAVRFKTAAVLASAADDRTVRLWARAGAAGTGDWTLRWTAWGHAARCWALAFASRGLVSTGEDGTARLWDEASGAPLAVLRGHPCRSVWSVDALGSHVATGGNDGSIALFDLECQMRQRRQTGEPIASRSWEATYLVPDWCVPEGTVDAGTSSDTEMKTPKTRPKHSAIVGMAFVASVGRLPQLLVAVRQGTIQSLALDSGEWKLWCPWWVPRLEAMSVSKSDGCCFAVSPSGGMAVVGTLTGDIVLVDRKRQVPCVLPSKNHRAVQKLQWVNGSLLLSMHIQTIVLWSLQNGDVSKAINGEHVSCVQVFRPGLKGVPICCWVNRTNSMLVSGDTRGNLSLFDASLSDESEHHPLSTLRAHGREHVNAIAWIGDRIFSVGNDGCIHESMLTEEKLLISLQSVRVSFFTAMDRVWNMRITDGTIDRVAGGYFGNLYCVVNLDTGYEMFRVDTGGRQRNTCMYADPIYDANDSITHTYDMRALISHSKDQSKSMAAFYLAVSSMNRKGETEIDISCNAALGPAASCAFARPLHGEVIFDSCMFSLNEESIALLTASEDCYSRLTIFRKGGVLRSYLLPSQAGGVRALSACRLQKSNKTLVAAGGGKLELHFFFVHDLTAGDATGLLVKHCGFGRACGKTSIDHRINALATIETDQMNAVLVAAGDSEGKIYLYEVPAIETQTGNISHGNLIFSDERPILSLEIVRTSFHLLLLAGTTGGDVIVLDISPGARGAWNNCQILLTYRAHQVGTNSVVAKLFQGDLDCVRVRICSGGDDHSIHCTDLLFKSGAPDHPSIAAKVRVKGGSSAIRDLGFLDENSFVSCSYDSQLRRWEISGCQVRCLSMLSVSVGDINCLSHIAHGSSHLIAVSGGGTEIFITTSDNA